MTYMRPECPWCLVLLSPLLAAYAAEYDPTLLPFAPKQGVYVKVRRAAGDAPFICRPIARLSPVVVTEDISRNDAFLTNFQCAVPKAVSKLHNLNPGEMLLLVLASHEGHVGHGLASTALDYGLLLLTN
jgi:hypothetical protein